mgnify:CR=1 FL=1
MGDPLPIPVPTGKRTVLAPDASLASAVGAAHTLESALADIIDNSVDAGARHILVQFLTSDKAVEGLMIIDDGVGMDAAKLDAAMRYGQKREYGVDALGHFGVGMKAASMSQADRLTVFSRKIGYTPQGRGMSKASVDAGAPTMVEYDQAQVGRLFEHLQTPFPMEHGTVVRWDEPRNFIVSTSVHERMGWQQQKRFQLSTYLGLIFHRRLAAGEFSIAFREFYETTGEVGSTEFVQPVDPFDYMYSGGTEFPIDLFGSIDGVDFTFTVHLWPVGSEKEPNFALLSGDGNERQGFYVYRNDRLLQYGGWNGLFNVLPKRKYLRVSLDLPRKLERYVRMNPEKANIEFTQPFVNALKAARSRDGRVSLEDVTDLADMAARGARKRRTRTHPVARPEGLPQIVVGAIEDNLGFDPVQDPVEIVWQQLAPKKVFEFVPDLRKLVLNTELRRELTGTDTPVTDGRQAPFIVTLIYLLMRDEFKRHNAGKQWKQDQNDLQRVLYQALRADDEWRAKVARAEARRRERDGYAG